MLSSSIHLIHLRRTFRAQLILCAHLCVPKLGAEGGHGIAFVVSPSLDFTHADPTQYLGLSNISTNGSPSYQLLAIELDTTQNVAFNNIDKNHVGIDINSLKSIESASASYYSNTKGKNQSMKLLSEEPFQVWVDYERTVLNVTMAPLGIQKPNYPLLSRSINLTQIFQNQKVLFQNPKAKLSSLDKIPAEKRHLIKWVCDCWRSDSLLDAIDIRLGHEYSEEEIYMVLKLELLCTNAAAESRPTMEQVVQYINKNLPLSKFSPNSPGIGVYIPVLLDAAFTSRSSLAPSASPFSPHNSMFVTHTYGDGR